MQNELFGLTGTLALAAALAISACSGSDDGGAATTGDAAGPTTNAGAVSTSDGASTSTTGSMSTAGTASSTGTMTSGGAGGTSGASLCMDAGTEVTSLCSTATLDMLSEAEEAQLCTDTGAYLAGALARASACKYHGIINAASSSSPTEEEMQAVCAQAEADCNADSSIAGPGENTLCSQIPESCPATVTEYSECVKAEAVAFDQAAAALVECSGLTFENLSSSYDVPMAAGEAAGCAALKTACPSFSVPYIN